MASDRSNADFDADVARVARAARSLVVGFWCAAAAGSIALLYVILDWLPRQGLH